MLEHAGTIKFSMTSLFYRTYFRVVDNKSQVAVDFDFFFFFVLQQEVALICHAEQINFI